MAAFTAVTIEVTFVPRTVTITAETRAGKEYTYVGESSKRLKEILDKVAVAYSEMDAESFVQNVSTDGSFKLLPGP